MSGGSSWPWHATAGCALPTETLKLQWTDVLWDQDKMRVTAAKTEHHPGKGERWVPIFPELRPFLDKAWEEATEGAVYVISRTRDAKVNWRTTLLKIIRRAGLTPWTKPFQNMRATRETELADQFPAHVVSGVDRQFRTGSGGPLPTGHGRAHAARCEIRCGKQPQRPRGRVTPRYNAG